jgi:anti-anti-sigma factor
MSGMQITEYTRAGWHVVSVAGRVDNATADTLTTTLRQAVASHAQVAVDCSAIDYMSSAGIGALVEGAAAARRAGQRFSVCTPSPRVEQVLKICRLDALIPIEPALPS